MTVNVLLFAGLRQTVGSEVVKVELSNQATYAELLTEFGTRYPSSAPLLAVSRIAARGEFVSPQSLVDSTAEIAIIPPVSGG